MLSAAKHLLFLTGKQKQILRFAQDDIPGGVSRVAQTWFVSQQLSAIAEDKPQSF
jgi:hypothetical protein